MTNGPAIAARSPSDSRYDFLPNLEQGFTDHDAMQLGKTLSEHSAQLSDDLKLSNYGYMATLGGANEPPIVRAHAAYIVATHERTPLARAQELSRDFAHHIVAATQASPDPVANKTHTAYAMFLVAQGAYDDTPQIMSDRQSVMRAKVAVIAPMMYEAYAMHNPACAFHDNQVHILKRLGMMVPADDLYKSFTRVADAMLNSASEKGNVAELSMLLKGIEHVSDNAGGQIQPLLDIWAKGHDRLSEINPPKALEMAQSAATNAYGIVHPKLWAMATQRVASIATCHRPDAHVVRQDAPTITLGSGSKR